MRIISTITQVILLVASLTTYSAFAEESSPYVVLEKAGTSLFTRIATHQQEIQKFPEYMRIIVDEELMPSIDYKYAAYRILGKNLPKMTKTQRASFVNSMRHYLVTTYANALKQYKKQQVIFETEKPTQGKRIVAVKTQIVEMNKPTIDVIFQMRQNKKTKQWKAYDMVVEGISLLDSKQKELTQRIAKQGVDQVSLELAALAK